ncbi:MAG: sulfate adenylyltransferase subunit CysD [Alphaproteobacteria bacterium]|nr:sulfate adenylyltransferase subunit CysD [Alphaproteobacteria bacterium]
MDSVSILGRESLPAPAPAGSRLSSIRHLELLESEAIFVLREAAAEAAKPVLLFSGGKDSTVLLRLAEKAFRPGRFPFPLLHVDTGHNFPEVIAFRDRIAAELNERLIVRTVQAAIDRGRIRLKSPEQSRNALQSIVLLDAIAEFGFDACIGGARRDEEKSRAKERIFSFRNAFGEWDPRSQRPELWSLFNARVDRGEHMRVFPLSNWTEIDIWQYIAREQVPLPALYYAHRRAVAVRGDGLLPVSEFAALQAGDVVETRTVRFRTVGDISCTQPVESNAATAEAVIAETLTVEVSERGATRLDDRTSEASLELRKRAGYF